MPPAEHGEARDARALGITADKPCLDDAPVPPTEDDRRRLLGVTGWIAWATFAVVAAVALARLL